MSEQKRETFGRVRMIEILASAADGDTLPLVVTGASMTPFLFHQRSMVYLKKDLSFVPKRGDIVFFAREDLTLVLHRVVALNEDGTLLINGDAQSWTEVIRPDQILAHVTHIRRRVKVFSVNARFYRMMVRLWMPLRRAHPLLMKPFLYVNSAIFKLSRRYRELYR